jgi:hypothetical protein
MTLPWKKLQVAVDTNATVENDENEEVRVAGTNVHWQQRLGLLAVLLSVASHAKEEEEERKRTLQWRHIIRWRLRKRGWGAQIGPSSQHQALDTTIN